MTEGRAAIAAGLRDQTPASVAPAAVIGVDLQGDVIAWNGGAAGVFGWVETDVIGRRLPIVAEAAWPEFELLLTLAARGHPVSNQTLRYQRRDGTEIDMELSATPLRDSQGKPTGLLAVLVAPAPSEDTWLDAAAVPATAANARLEAVGRLAGGVAHDFNNILTAIAGYAGLLAIEMAADDPKQGDVAEIRKATERASRLTRQLMAFGRREPREAQGLDLNEVITDVLPMMRQLIGEHIDLITNAEATLAAIFADPGQMEQVLVNLLLNARDAMPGGGQLVVSTGVVELDAGFVAGHPGSRPGRFVRLTVEDTGSGMDSEVLAHIFEPYFTTKEPGRGTGLGLSTVYGIVKASAGYISAESELGRGSVVSVYLPARSG